jgi:hypothetical protein
MTDDSFSDRKRETAEYCRERAEAIAGLRRGLDSVERGEGVPLEEAMEALQKKLGIPLNER